MLGISELMDKDLQSIETALIRVVTYMDRNEDANDLTEALNHVQNVQHRRDAF
jgi:hypothetical protein